VAFSPDGRLLASGSADQTVKLWDSASGKELFSLQGHTKGVTSVAFSPDGTRLASASDDKTVRVWDSATGWELFPLKGHASAVAGVAFSPDGRRLASGGWTAKIWDSATGKELLSLNSKTASYASVAFSPDGQRLASGNRDGSINLWETTILPEVQDRRAARQLVTDLFRQKGLRADVLDWLQTVPGMSLSRRQEALATARMHPEDPSVLNHLAWELVKLPGRATPDYQQALRCSEAACQLEPGKGAYLTTLGVTHYRTADHAKALEILRRSDAMNQKQDQGTLPADLAFLAMTQHRLGHPREAQAELRRLRERMKDPRWAEDAEAQGFLREAEALLAKPLTPGGK
jgi:hypothetical protein